MPALLLQKPSKASKAKDHLKALERRLRVWEEENIIELVNEGKTIQDKYFFEVVKSSRVFEHRSIFFKEYRLLSFSSIPNVVKTCNNKETIWGVEYFAR